MANEIDRLKGGMEHAATICEDRAKRYRANGTTTGPLQASAADSCAYHIRKAAQTRVSPLDQISPEDLEQARAEFRQHPEVSGEPLPTGRGAEPVPETPEEAHERFQRWANRFADIMSDNAVIAEIAEIVAQRCTPTEALPIARQVFERLKALKVIQIRAMIDDKS